MYIYKPKTAELVSDYVFSGSVITKLMSSGKLCIHLWHCPLDLYN